MLIDEQTQLELQQRIPGHTEEISDIHISLQRSLRMTTWDFPACSGQRSLFHSNGLNQHFLQTFDDVFGKMCGENNLKNGSLEIDFSTTVFPLITVVCVIISAQ